MKLLFFEKCMPSIRNPDPNPNPDPDPTLTRSLTRVAQPGTCRRSAGLTRFNPRVRVSE